MATGNQEHTAPQPSVVDLERYMELYQQADAAAVAELVAALSPALTFLSQSGAKPPASGRPAAGNMVAHSPGATHLSLR